MMMPKKKRWKCRAYLNWVKQQTCIISGAPADDPHHIIAHGMGGMGTKAPDWAVMPVTRGSHTEIHRTACKNDDQWEHVARTLGKAIEDGVLVFKK